VLGKFDYCCVCYGSTHRQKFIALSVCCRSISKKISAVCCLLTKWYNIKLGANRRGKKVSSWWQS